MTRVLASLSAAALLGLSMTVTPLAVEADEVSPALIYNLGAKFDRSFNEAAFRGAEAFKEKTGIGYLEFQPTVEAQRVQAMRNMARRGANIIVAVSFMQTAAVETVAAEQPDLKFTLIDGVVEAPNVQSIVFKEHEGSYLVGLLAAMASQSGKVGFVGGMDIPLIRKFACGYEQGARSVDPDAEVLVSMTGNTPAAWNDPTKGGELAQSQIDRGVDVIFAAAGATGLGVLQTVADQGKLGIGVDSNQNHLHPGNMLTSMLKQVDVATETAFSAVKAGTWKPGVSVLGLAEGGVGWALDEHNRDLITAEMEAAVNAARDRIVSGEITVTDYMAGSHCDY